MVLLKRNRRPEGRPLRNCDDEKDGERSGARIEPSPAPINGADAEVEDYADLDTIHAGEHADQDTLAGVTPPA
jgi:hypothetical protein